MGYTHHDGISVFGSGLAVGKKTVETLVMDKSGVLYADKIMDQAGNKTIINTSGYVQPGFVQKAGSAETAGIKWDYGTQGFSGWLKTAVSTAMSSISWAQATVKLPLLATQLQPTGASGIPSIVFTQWSGHTLDFTVYSVTSSQNTGLGNITSNGVSTIIAWIAFGT